MGILRLQGWACALTAIQTSTPILSSCHLVMHGLVGTRNQKEVGRGECPWPCNVGCWGRVPPVAGARGLISKAYRTSRSWPTSRRCTQGAKPATQCCTRILPAWFRPQLLRPLQLSTTIDRRPSTVDHHGDPLPPSLFFCSAGTLPPPRERERESPHHLQLHPRFVLTRDQDPLFSPGSNGFRPLFGGFFPSIVNPRRRGSRKLPELPSILQHQPIIHHSSVWSQYDRSNRHTMFGPSRSRPVPLPTRRPQIS